MTILVTSGAGFIGSNFVLDWQSVKDHCSAIRRVPRSGQGPRNLQGR